MGCRDVSPYPPARDGLKKRAVPLRGRPFLVVLVRQEFTGMISLQA